VLPVRKLCNRKKPAPTMAYVASSLGQQATRIMQSARIIAVAVTATDGSGKTSAVMIPVAARNARPTNGWRGALSDFICCAFRLSSVNKASPQSPSSRTLPEAPSAREPSRATSSGRNRESDSFLYSETMKAMRRHLALQSTSCEMTGDGCFVLRELLECVRVLAPLFHTVTMRTCIKG